jgi:23S rRNA pseudouridine1911/1915/1917 synthase
MVGKRLPAIDENHNNKQKLWTMDYGPSNQKMARPEFNYISKDITDADILYEDNHLIAVNKRAGDIVQVDDTGDESLDEKVKKVHSQKYSKPNGAFLGVVHRLDRPVSGVILFAKTSKALERINKMFKGREMHKTYYAIVRKRPQPEAGNLVHYLIKNPQKNVTKAHDKEVAGSQRSELNYKLVGERGWLLCNRGRPDNRPPASDKGAAINPGLPNSWR